MYTLEKLCADIGLAEEVTQQVLALNIPADTRLRYEETWEEGLAAFADDPLGLRMLACQLGCALEAKKDYDKLGISHKVFVDTMACFTRFVNEHMVSYGRYGFDRGFWSVRQISCKIFRIGQLEYELYAEDGKKAVSIHIPSDAKLEPPLLRQSWEQAKALIGTTFPDYADVPYICKSWLLSPDLKELLPEDSRILAFQRNFHMEKAFPDESFREWVFKNRDIPNNALTEHTSLQRKLKAFVLAGNTFHNGEGMLIEEPFPTKEKNMEYKEVQKIAKDTIRHAKQSIKPGMNLRDIRKMCDAKMLELGADSFWYWDVGAFVFAGDETTVSVSGRTYTTSDRIIAPNDIITIDLSPQNGDTWGDYARTIVLQNGVVVDVDGIENQEWKQGLLMEGFLHDELAKFAKPETTFEELYYHMNKLIEAKGFINLDFAGNLGHSIVRHKDDRVYIEKGNHIHLGDVAFFTFEPHISVKDSKYGYKKENIYYFQDGILKEL